MGLLGHSIKWIGLTGPRNHKEITVIMENELKVPTMAELFAAGQQPEVLFWVGCAGSFDAGSDHHRGIKRL